MSTTAEKKLKFGRWEKLQVCGAVPSVRFAHSSVVVVRDATMYVFGGSSYGSHEDTEYHNDMYRLKLGESLLWEKVDQKGDIPSPREGAILIAVQDKLYLYGGTDKEGAISCAQGLFQFSIETSTWSKHDTKGPAPKALSMAGALCDMKIVTFGGVLYGKGCSSVHILNIESLEWSEVAAHGTSPKPRCDHAITVSRQHVFVCAGTGSDELWFNDLHRLSVDSLEWREVKQKGNPPSPRDYATLVSISDWYLVMFGGSCAMGESEECFSDLHYIDITASSPEWCKVKVEGDREPSPRYSHTMVVWSNKLYVFGGQDNDGVLNDVWTIEFTLPLSKFQPTPVPRHSYATSVPVPAPRKIVPPAEPKTAEPRDFEELRSTYIKRINEMFDSLSERFQQLDEATETLAVERNAFETEKKEHAELYQQQQSELQGMLERHRTQNEEWLEKTRAENDADRKELAEQKAVLERAQEELAKDNQAFAEKSQKLDSIMKQVQGLQ